jgi:uncharacterized membrane protein YwaF
MVKHTLSHRRLPVFSSLGLIIQILSVSWVVYKISTSVDSPLEFGSSAVFSALPALMIMIPASFIFGVIGIIRSERPRYLTLTVTAFSSVIIAAFLVIIYWP